MARFTCNLLPIFRHVTVCGAIICLPGCGFLLPPETGFEPSDTARGAAFPALLQRPKLEAASAPRLVPPSAPLEDRVAQLRNRADGLTGPVLDTATQARLNAAAESAGF